MGCRRRSPGLGAEVGERLCVSRAKGSKSLHFRERRGTFLSGFLACVWRKGVLDRAGGHDGLGDSCLLFYHHLWPMRVTILLVCRFFPDLAQVWRRRGRLQGDACDSGRGPFSVPLWFPFFFFSPPPPKNKMFTLCFAWSRPGIRFLQEPGFRGLEILPGTHTWTHRARCCGKSRLGGPLAEPAAAFRTLPV